MQYLQALLHILRKIFKQEVYGRESLQKAFILHYCGRMDGGIL